VWVNRQDSSNVSADLMVSTTSYLKLEQNPGLKTVGFTILGVADYSFNYIAPLNTWTHLTFVGTSTNTSLYVNGAFQNSIATSITLPMKTIADSQNSVKGSLDEIRAYSRHLRFKLFQGQLVIRMETRSTGNSPERFHPATDPTGAISTHSSPSLLALRIIPQMRPTSQVA